MKRYTLKVKTLDSSVTPNDLKLAIENVLLPLHPRITYRLGQIMSGGSDTILAEIASDARKELLEPHLKDIQSKLPVTIEKLGWGWTLTGKPGSPPADQGSPEEFSANAVSQASSPSFLLGNRAFLWRYIFQMSLTFLLVALLIAGFFIEKSTLLDGTFTVVFVVWIYFLTDMPLDIWRYAKRIECEPAELVLTYWFRKPSVRLNWETIWGFAYKGKICILHHDDNKSTRFLVSYGYRDKEKLFKTIVSKASLNAVETGISQAVYKRYEAP